MTSPDRAAEPDEKQIGERVAEAAQLFRRDLKIEAQGVRREVGERHERHVADDGQAPSVAAQERQRFHRFCRLVVHLLCSRPSCSPMHQNASGRSALRLRALRNGAQGRVV